MSSGKNKFFVIAGVALFALILAVVLAEFIFNMAGRAAIRRGAESIGCLVTGEKVTVEKIKFSILQARAEIDDIVVYNPKGYKSEFAIKLKRFIFDLDAGTAFSEKKVIEEFVIDGVRINYERSLTGSNIQDIKANIDAFMKRNASADEPADKKSPEKKRFQIDELVIRDVKITLSSTASQTLAIELTLPDIRLKDLGKDKPDGIDTIELIKKVSAAILEQTIETAQKAGLSAAVPVKDTINNALDSAGKAADSIKSLLK